MLVTLTVQSNLRLNIISTLTVDLLQEVRMPAGGSKHGVRNPCELKDDTASAREEKQVPAVMT